MYCNPIAGTFVFAVKEVVTAENPPRMPRMVTNLSYHISHLSSLISRLSRQSRPDRDAGQNSPLCSSCR